MKLKNKTKKTKKPLTSEEKLFNFQQALFDQVDNMLKESGITIVGLVGSLETIKTYYLNIALTAATQESINLTNKRMNDKVRNEMFG